MDIPSINRLLSGSLQHVNEWLKWPSLRTKLNENSKPLNFTNRGAQKDCPPESSRWLQIPCRWCLPLEQKHSAHQQNDFEARHLSVSNFLEIRRSVKKLQKSTTISKCMRVVVDHKCIKLTSRDRKLVVLPPKHDEATHGLFQETKEHLKYTVISSTAAEMTSFTCNQSL